MPRYYFDCVDGSRERDEQGVELDDLAAAREMAIRFAGEVLGEAPEIVRQNGQWRVEVSDAQGVLLFTMITLAVDARRSAPDAR